MSPRDLSLSRLTIAFGENEGWTLPVRDKLISGNLFHSAFIISRRFLSISFLLARPTERDALRLVCGRPPPKPQTLLPCSITSLPPAPHPSPFTSNLSPPQFVILSLCLSGSPPPSSYLGTTTALCCHDSEGNVEARDQPTCF